MKNFLFLVFIGILHSPPYVYGDIQIDQEISNLYSKDLVKKIEKNPKRWDELVKELHLLSTDQKLLDYLYFQTCIANLFEHPEPKKAIKLCKEGFKRHKDRKTFLEKLEKLTSQRKINLTILCGSALFAKDVISLSSNIVLWFRVMLVFVTPVCVIAVWDRMNAKIKENSDRITKNETDIERIEQFDEFQRERVRQLENQVNIHQKEISECQNDINGLKKLYQSLKDSNNEREETIREEYEKMIRELEEMIRRYEKVINDLQHRITAIENQINEYKRQRLQPEEFL